MAVGIRVGVAAVVSYLHQDPDDPQIVLIQRAQPGPAYGQWVLPGGRVQAYETLADALRRELWEELGQKAVVMDQVCTKELVEPEVERHRVIVIYRAILLSKELTLASEEALDGGWFSHQDLFALALSPLTRRVLKQIGW